MANELRVRTNNIGGLVEDNPLATAGTTLTSAGLQAIPAIGSTQHFPITIDPDGIGGAPEIAYVTAHTLAAGSGTILRGQEGTSARDHARDTPWIHGILASDFPVSSVYTMPASVAYTGTALGSLATPVLIAVTVLAGQVVDVEIELNGYCSGDNIVFWGIRRNPSTVLTKGTLYTAAQATRPNSMAARWTDTSPGSGSVTYELLVASTAGSFTATVSDATTTISATGSSGGGTQIKATPRWS